jgi:hypothetical protein
MKFKNKCTFIEQYSRPWRIINANSPELAFIAAISHENSAAALNIFHETKLFGAEPVVDAPHGRFSGKKAIREFAEDWLESFNASNAFVVPVVQTQAGGRSCTEMVVHFNVGGEYLRVPMIVVADLRDGAKADEIRIYFHYLMAPGFKAYRPPIFQPSFNIHGEYSLLTGAFGEYYRCLHERDLDKMLDVFDENICYGGYAPEEIHPLRKNYETIHEEYARVMSRVPSIESVRFESVIDDGVTGVIEWTLCVTDLGREKYRRVYQAGIAAYERGSKEKLLSVRICDYMDHEDDIEPELREKLVRANAGYEFKAKLPTPPAEGLIDERGQK